VLNGYRRTLVRAIITDTILRGLCGPHGNVRYLGCETGTAQGESAVGDMTLNFNLTYLFNPTEL
jgi:hypothetical protein